MFEHLSVDIGWGDYEYPDVLKCSLSRIEEIIFRILSYYPYTSQLEPDSSTPAISTATGKQALGTNCAKAQFTTSIRRAYASETQAANPRFSGENDCLLSESP